MKKIIFSIIILFSFSNLSVQAQEKKCGAFDIGCKAKNFIEKTKKFQKKGIDESKEQVGKTKKKILKGKDLVLEDVKDTSGGVTDTMKDAVGGIKKKSKK
jgi:hypothetical protein